MPMPFSGVLTFSQQRRRPQHILLYKLLSTVAMEDGDVCKLRTEVVISVHLLIPEMTPAGASPGNPYRFGVGVETEKGEDEGP